MKPTFTNGDLQKAIAAEIFDENNNITATSPAQIIRYFEAWAAKKCSYVQHTADQESQGLKSAALKLVDEVIKHHPVVNMETQEGLYMALHDLKKIANAQNNNTQ